MASPSAGAGFGATFGARTAPAAFAFRGNPQVETQILNAQRQQGTPEQFVAGEAASSTVLGQPSVGFRPGRAMGQKTLLGQ